MELKFKEQEEILVYYNAVQWNIGDLGVAATVVVLLESVG